MKRHAFAMEIKKGCKGEFRRSLGKIWGEFTLFLNEHGMTNFSIWNVDRIVFGYYETVDEFVFSLDDKEIVQKWENQYGDLYMWISTPLEDISLMNHDFGIVRQSKELIRHSFFITQLMPGAEEEYKRRHDALIEARQGKVTKGPDSNFSIWYAGGYIFGYDEIDTTMEKELTEEEKEASIQWEIKMLEIMSWITDKNDWITGEHHSPIHRIGWYR